MASSNRRASLSPSEHQRVKSQSSYRSHRTTSSVTVNERERTSSQASKRSTREINPTKRSESSASNRSTTIASPVSNRSKKNLSNLKSSTSPVANRRPISKSKKRPISVGDTEQRRLSEPNNSEKQDLTAQGLSMVPAELFESKFTIYLNSFLLYIITFTSCYTSSFNFII